VTGVAADMRWKVADNSARQAARNLQNDARDDCTRKLLQYG
jgi:hypothetical protein